MTAIDREIAAFDAMRASLQDSHMGKWVLVHDGALISVFASFEEAADSAVREFGRGPYLIRQVGAAPMVMPASVAFNVQHAQRSMRLR